jgi:hypothetical protein
MTIDGQECQLVCIPPDKAVLVWPHVSGLIHAAIKRGDLSSFGPVEQSVLRGDALLWLAWDGERIQAAAVTELHRTEWRKVCVVVACGAPGRSRASGHLRPSSRKLLYLSQEPEPAAHIYSPRSSSPRSSSPAIDALYGAGGQTAGLLSNLDQARLANQQAGIGAADTALTAQNWGPTQQLEVEAQRRGIPLQTLAAQYGMVLPAAQAFATTAGTSSGSSSGATSGTSVGSGTQQKTESTPFNPWSLVPLALMPFTGGTSLAGGAASALGGGFFSSLTNGFMGPNSFNGR